MRMFAVITLLLGSGHAAFACNTTLSGGASRASIDTALATYSHVCLGAGTFNLGSTTLDVPANKTLDGASMASTTVNSTANRAITIASGSTVKDFKLVGGGPTTNEYGVLTYATTGATIWSVDIRSFLISVGVVNSTGANIWDTFVSDNGHYTNGLADPNIYISNSDNTWLYYGAVTGDGRNSIVGDGEISCYDSENVHIQGTVSWDSGTSAVYFVNCDNATIEDMDIYWPGGFGLDIVGDSDGVAMRNNYIQDAWFAGSVYDNTTNSGGSYIGNTFSSNNDSGDSRFCSGIELFSSSPQPSNSGNSVSPGSLFCP